MKSQGNMFAKQESYPGILISLELGNAAAFDGLDGLEGQNEEETVCCKKPEGSIPGNGDP